MEAFSTGPTQVNDSHHQDHGWKSVEKADPESYPASLSENLTDGIPTRARAQ